MQRYGPEVVDLAFKMRCFGDVLCPKNNKKFCFSLLKQQLYHAKEPLRQQGAAHWRFQTDELGRAGSRQEESGRLWRRPWTEGLPAEKGHTEGDQDPEPDTGTEAPSRPESRGEETCKVDDT